jgi:exportin-1
LFLEDKETERAAQAAKEKEQAAKIPGMLKPTEIKDEDEEL